MHGRFITQSVTCDTVPLVSPKRNLVQYMVQANKAVRISGRPNFSACRIPVPSSLNFEYLEKELADYKDRAIIQLLRYGCPINYEGPGNLSRACHNHRGATDFPEHIERFLKREVEAASVMGPFKSSPFDIPTTVSPLNTVPKRDSADRRVIVDLSFPKCKPLESVNGGISRDCYLGDPIQLRYPSVDNLVNLVRCKGPGCCLFKCDLSRAYRQLPVDPGDLHYLGYKWNGELYIDATLTMGLRSAAFLCQRVTNAIAYIARNNGVSVSNYLDDFGGVEVKDSATEAFLKLRGILKQSGLVESPTKACWPNVRMVFLGIMVDTERMVLEVSPDRLQELHGLLQGWMERAAATKKQTQSLVGVLQFVAICVKPGRVFMARLLNFLRSCPELGECPVPDDLRADLRWWLTFLPHYNGVSVIPEVDWSDPDATFACDACLSGAGGWFQGQYFHTAFPAFIQELGMHINGLEMLTLTVALKVWGRFLSGKKVTMWCDNLSSVVVIQTGKARDPFLQACLRELVFLQARWECQIRVQHIRGEDNRLPDLLSRWESSPKYREEFFARTQGLQLREIYIYEGLFRFSHNW